MSTKKLGINKSQVPNRQLRRFSEAFKLKKVKELESKQITVTQESKQITVTQISVLYEVTRSAVYKWLHKYGSLERGVKVVVQMESEAQKTIVLLKRVAELERIIGQKQLALDVNEKVFELLQVDLGYDVKKKYEEQLSNGSAGIKSTTNIE